jgi:predicted transglutaminase-like protease
VSGTAGYEPAVTWASLSDDDRARIIQAYQDDLATRNELLLVSGAITEILIGLAEAISELAESNSEVSLKIQSSLQSLRVLNNLNEVILKDIKQKGGVAEEGSND